MFANNCFTTFLNPLQTYELSKNWGLDENVSKGRKYVIVNP